MARKKSVNWLKAGCGILLLPVCWAGFFVLARVLAATGPVDVVWVPLVAGLLCWTVVYSMLPEPLWMYVLGHELTHALWATLFGGRVKKIKVSSRGGHVVLTKSNFLITLAPYFFPFYAVIAAAIFGAGDWLWDWQAYRAVFLVLMGAAYGFHATMTWSILRTRQPDLVSEGWFFSAVVIVLGNLLVLILSIPLLTRGVPVLKPMLWWGSESWHLWRWLLRM